MTWSHHMIWSRGQQWVLIALLIYASYEMVTSYNMVTWSHHIIWSRGQQHSRARAHTHTHARTHTRNTRTHTHLLTTDLATSSATFCPTRSLIRPLLIRLLHSARYHMTCKRLCGLRLYSILGFTFIFNLRVYVYIQS